MRPRLDKKDFVLVLEALAHLYQFFARKRDRYKAYQVYLLFESLANQKIGRRRRWLWNSEELISKWKRNYKNMLEKIEELKTVQESGQPQRS